MPFLSLRRHVVMCLSIRKEGTKNENSNPEIEKQRNTITGKDTPKRYFWQESAKNLWCMVGTVETSVYRRWGEQAPSKGRPQGIVMMGRAQALVLASGSCYTQWNYLAWVRKKHETRNKTAQEFIRGDVCRLGEAGCRKRESWRWRIQLLKAA